MLPWPLQQEAEVPILQTCAAEREGNGANPEHKHAYLITRKHRKEEWGQYRRQARVTVTNAGNEPFKSTKPLRLEV